MTMSAGAPSENEVALRHPRTRLLELSAMYRRCGVTLASTAICSGEFWELAVSSLAELCVKSGCPRTSEAFSSLVKGARYSTARLLLESETNKSPAASSAKPAG